MLCELRLMLTCLLAHVIPFNLIRGCMCGSTEYVCICGMCMCGSTEYVCICSICMCGSTEYVCICSMCTCRDSFECYVRMLLAMSVCSEGDLCSWSGRVLP
jgi:hypothetical protein